MKTLEVEVVRVKITLACTECKQRNYNMTKEKKNHPERLETKKNLLAKVRREIGFRDFNRNSKRLSGLTRLHL